MWAYNPLNPKRSQPPRQVLNCYPARLFVCLIYKLHVVYRSAYSGLILVKWVMEPNRDMSGELKCTDSQAMRSQAAGVWRAESGCSSAAPHESFISVFEHWSDWVLAQRLDSALEGSAKSKFSHVSTQWGNKRTSARQKEAKKGQSVSANFLLIQYLKAKSTLLPSHLIKLCTCDGVKWR